MQTMKSIHIVLLLGTLLLCSCKDKIGAGAGIDDWYFIYITGDTGKIIKISYLERPAGVELPKDNVTVTESVTLPFFKEVHTIDWPDGLGPDSFLEITSKNDSTTRAVIFDDALPLSDGKCGVIEIFYTENAVGDCAYCADLSKDSVLNYLKSIDYPCYLEFSKEETTKKVRLHDWWYNYD